MAAGRMAWTFVDADRFAAMEPPVQTWTDRLTTREAPDDLLVAADATGVGGFVRVRLAEADDLPDRAGEVAALDTHPRMWGGVAGRSLMALALDRLRAKTCRTAVLYTEQRNERPRQIYEQLGWRLDGASRVREFLGAPIRESRYRLQL